MNAVEYFKNGYSCSESIIKWGIDEGLVPEELLPVATPFSGGMGSGCLCGAIAGAQMIIGYFYGKNNKFENEALARSKAKEVIKRFIGEIEQIPPMYSAIKVDGRKLYQLARRGVEIERKPRKVTIHSIKISNFDGENFDMEVHCGKGTYIRALCRDIGDALGTGAVMSELERTRTGIFKKENAYTLEEIEKLAESGEIERILIPPDAILEDLERIDVDSAHEQKIKNGIRLRPEQLNIKKFNENDMYRIYKDDKFIAILKVADCNGELLLAIEKSFY